MRPRFVAVILAMLVWHCSASAAEPPLISIEFEIDHPYVRINFAGQKDLDRIVADVRTCLRVLVKQNYGFLNITTEDPENVPNTLRVILRRATDASVGVQDMVFRVELTGNHVEKPSNRWLDQFRGKSLSPRLRLGDELDGITGATYSANAVTGAVRRALAIYEVILSTGKRVRCSGS